MNRFTFTFATGSLLLCGSQIFLNLGLHPEHQASVLLLGQGILGLVLGTALAVTGLLGLVEGYQKAGARVRQLLHSRELDFETTAQTLGELDDQQRGFWKSYRKSALGLLLFLGGVLVLGAALYKTEFLLYLVASAFGIFCLGVVSLLLTIQGVRALRRHTKAAERTALAIQEQPLVPVPSPLRPVPKWAVYSPDERLRHFRRHSTFPSSS